MAEELARSLDGNQVCIFLSLRDYKLMMHTRSKGELVLVEAYKVKNDEY